MTDTLPAPMSAYIARARACASVEAGIAAALAENLRIKRLARKLAPLHRAEVVTLPVRRSAYEQLPADTEPA